MFHCLQSELNGLSTVDDDTNYEPPTKTPSPMPPSASSLDLVNMLEDRLENYKTAHENAKSTGDNSKLRRMDRGVKVRPLNLPVITYSQEGGKRC